MSNALRCHVTKNCSGFLLPKDPVDLDSRWFCNICSKSDENLSENNSLSPEIVRQIYEKMDKEIKMIENMVEEEQVN